MKISEMLAPLALCATLLAAVPGSAPAAEPEKILPSAFSASLDSSSKTVEVTFALALSETPTYPVTIFAVSGSTEEQLWQGSLSGGVYRITLPITKISSGPVKIVMRTKIVNRNEKGSDSYLVIQTWEGSL